MTVATPGVGSANSSAILAAQTLAQKAQVTGQEHTTLGQMRSTYSYETAPQLQSGIASSGQWYGSNRQTATDNAYRHQTDAESNVVSAASRQLDDLTRQQAYASLGLII